MTPHQLAWNLLLYAGQIFLIVAACAGAHRLLRIRSAGLQYLFWRVVLAAILLLPVVQPWHALPPASALPASVAVTSTSTGSATASSGPDLFIGFERDFATPLLVILAAGALARALWIGAGLWRLRRLRTTAIAAAWPEADDLQRMLRTRALIGTSTGVVQPVTFGTRPSIVLLPASAASLPPPARRAVLAHELFHVRRRDWVWLLAEEALRAAFWWHPAMWWLISRVQLARETVVDELSILATNARRLYLDTLLAYADAPPLAPAPAFARRRHLVYRITLLSQEGTMSASRLLVASTVLIGVLGVAGVTAVRAFPLQQPPRDPVPGQLTPDQRAVSDRNLERLNAAIAREPNAPDLQHQLAALLWRRGSEDGALTRAERQRYMDDAIAAETRALAIRPDYLPALASKQRMLETQAARATDALRRDALLTQARQLESQLASARRTSVRQLPPPPPPPPLASNTAVQPVRVGSGIHAPTKIKNVNAVYPPEAKAAGVQGVVIIECLIGVDGRVVNARILRSIPALDQAALDAVRQWAYAPTVLNGAAVPVILTVTVNFTLYQARLYMAK